MANKFTEFSKAIIREINEHILEIIRFLLFVHLKIVNSTLKR